MQVGLRPSLKARASLVDLLRKSRQEVSAIHTASSPPTSAAPQSGQTANQGLPPTSLASEALDIASTYHQLPSAPSKLDVSPSPSPSPSHRTLQQEFRPLSPPFYSSESKSDSEDVGARPVTPSKMASVSLVRPNIPLAGQALVSLAARD
jgi:hypothetical protein